MRRFFSILAIAAVALPLAACGDFKVETPSSIFEADLEKLGYTVNNVTSESESGENILEAAVDIDNGSSLKCAVEFERKADETASQKVDDQSMAAFWLDELVRTGIFSGGNITITDAPDSPSLEETYTYLETKQSDSC